MKIIIVGCGKIGKVLLYSLAKENHNITGIDNNPAVVEQVRNGYDVLAVLGNGTSYSVLREADAANCDLFIAVTASDELNMLSCFAAKKLGAKHTVARIRKLENNDDGLSFMAEQLDLSMVINPEQLTAQTIYNLLKLPAAAKIETFSTDQLEMLEIIIKPDSRLEGVPLKDLRRQYRGKYLICSVKRDNDVFIPNGDFSLKSGDRVGLIVAEDDLFKTLEMLDIAHKRVKSVMVVGAGLTTRYLANILLEHRIPVKIIEKDPAVCEKVCEDLPSRATVINGDAMSQDLLIEEGISGTDGMVALTGRDEENILISYYARLHSVPKIVAKVNRDELFPLVQKMGLDSIISPRLVAADRIVKYARALESTRDSQIETLYSIMGVAEALEFKVLSGSKCTGVPLKEMKLKKGVLIAGIIRGKEAIIPNGDDMIMTEDRVIVISAGQQIKELSDILL